MLSRLIFIGLSLVSFAAKAQPAWNFAPFVSGSGTFSVLLDTTPLSAGDVLERAEITVRFLRSNGNLIGTQSYQLVPGSGLAAGKVYQIDVRHDYGGAARVDGNDLQWGSHELGGKSDSILPKAHRRRISRPVDVRIAQTDPAVPSSLVKKRCIVYADLAKAADAINRDRQCGLQFSNDDYLERFHWCVSASPAQVEIKTRRRSELLLRQCRH